MGNGGMQGKTGKEKEDKTVIQEKNAEIAVYATIEEAERSCIFIQDLNEKAAKL